MYGHSFQMLAKGTARRRKVWKVILGNQKSKKCKA
jgi:hypothetical protein